MKVRLGNITIRQRDILCSKNEKCRTCPLFSQTGNEMHFYCNIDSSMKRDYGKEIDLPDEEENENGKTDL